MNLKFKKHYYGDSIKEHEVEVPSDIVFVHVEGDVGQVLYKGFGHYLGCSQTLIDSSSCAISICKDFPEVYLYIFNNVVFESDITIISSEEFTTKFELNKCYVFTYTKDKVKILNNIKLSSYNDILGNCEIIKGRLVSVSKILKVRSHNLIDVMSVAVSSWIDFSKEEVKIIQKFNGKSLDNLIDDNFNRIEIKKDADEEFTEAINQVLSIVNKSVI